MILNEDLFELIPDVATIEIPVVDVQDELTIDDIEQGLPATPEENGVAMSLSSTISDLWQKVNDYNSLIATVNSSGIESAEDIVTILKDVVDDEIKNIGKLQSALEEISPNVSNLEVGEQEAEMKLDENYSDLSSESKKNLLNKGFNIFGSTYVFLGNTYERKDDIKKAGGKFDPTLGWHIDSKVPGFDFVEVDFDDVAEEFDPRGWGEIIYKPGAKEKIEALKYKTETRRAGKQESSYIGEIGDTYQGRVTLVNIGGYEYSPAAWVSTFVFVYTFEDENNNKIVWKTSKDLESDNDIKEGDTLTIKGIIKNHSTFRGVPQTILTRCKLTESLRLVEEIEEDKVDELSALLGRSLSTSDVNYIYDGWRAVYNDPKAYEGSVVVDMVNLGLDTNKDMENAEEEPEDLSDESEEQDLFLGDVINYDDIKDEKDDSMEESYMPDKVRQLGSAEYDANEGRKSRIAMYRQLANLEEDFEITEDNIDSWALNRTASYYNRPRRRVKAEILGQKWSDLEE